MSIRMKAWSSNWRWTAAGMAINPPPRNTPVDIYQSDGVVILGPVRLIPMNGDGSVKFEDVNTGRLLPGGPVFIDPIEGNKFILTDARKRRLTQGLWSWEHVEPDPPYFEN